MEFCPKCGSILVKKRKNDGCARCNYTKKGKVQIKTSENLEEKKEIAIVSDKDPQVYPIVDAKCSKCKNKRAYFWTLQTRSSDEAETKFFKCTECEFTWRDYA